MAMASDLKFIEIATKQENSLFTPSLNLV